MLKKIAIAFSLIVILTVDAEAKHIRYNHHIHSTVNNAQIANIEQQRFSWSNPLQNLTSIPGTVYNVSHPYFAWCGWWMRKHVSETLGMNFGPDYNRAIAWARVGRPTSGPSPGVIAVKRHHVMQVVSVPSPGRIVAISGNDGHRVKVRERSTKGIIAWRSLK